MCEKKMRLSNFYKCNASKFHPQKMCCLGFLVRSPHYFWYSLHIFLFALLEAAFEGHIEREAMALYLLMSATRMCSQVLKKRSREYNIASISRKNCFYF